MAVIRPFSNNSFVPRDQGNAGKFRRKQNKTAPDIEMAMENDKRKTYFYWLCGGMLQFGIFCIASNLYISLKRMRINLGKVEDAKDKLTILDTKEELTQADLQEKVRIVNNWIGIYVIDFFI